MIRTPLSLFFALLLMLTACEKETEVVKGNTAPPDSTVADAEYRQFVNRSYIVVRGSEPDSASMNAALQILKPAGFSESSRRTFLSGLFQSDLYKWQVFNTGRQDYLNNTDTVTMRQQLMLYNLFLTDSTYVSVWPILQYDVDRLELLVDAGNDYAQNLIAIRELHRRFINNWFYDQINMGSANFVIFSFQQFLNRNPQAQELSAGVSMVNGNFSVLFLQSGSSKEDYLNIFFNSADYIEGLVVRSYQRFLQRNPNSQEMSEATQKFQIDSDYEQLQIDILATDEFARN